MQATHPVAIHELGKAAGRWIGMSGHLGFSNRLHAGRAACRVSGYHTPDMRVGFRNTGGLAVLLAAGCVLYSEVIISPLFLLPSDVTRTSSSVVDLVEQGDFVRAISYTRSIESRPRPLVRELAALGRAELAAGRFDQARRHLRTALDLNPSRTQMSEIAWDLSQTEYLANNYSAAEEWADLAHDTGLNIRNWHRKYLTALSDVNVYQFTGPASARVPMVRKLPKVPRIGVEVNGRANTMAVIDSGAVLSIISRKFATQIGVRSLGDFRGTFFGLLGEPIEVGFGLVDSIRIGDMVIHEIPVAIMPDEKLNFFILNRERFQMDLLLGCNLLKETRMELDFPSNQVTFQRLDPSMRGLRADQNLFFMGFRPFVHATLNRKGWYLFVLDTGSEITFLNESELVNTSLGGATKVHDALLQGLGGARKHGTKVENVEIGVDQWKGLFKNLPLYSTEQSKALGILGEDFLSNFIVTVDFGTMRVDLRRDRGGFREPDPRIAGMSAGTRPDP